MSSARIGISPEAFVSAFPFHLVFDRSFTILQVGPSLTRVSPSIQPGVHASAVLRVARPPVGFEWDAIRDNARSVFLLEAGAAKLLLRGQMITEEAAGTVTFLGSPRITDLSSLTSLGLSLDDFALHDAAADLLFLLQSKNTTLSDAKRLMAELTSQRLELRKANRKLGVQFAVTRTLIDASSVEEAMRGILAALGEGLAASLAAWWEVEEKAQVLRCAEVWNGGGTRLAALEGALRSSPVASGVGLPGQAWSRSQVVFAGEVDRGGCEALRAATEAGLRDAFAFPILASGTVLGVVALFCDHEVPVEEDLRRLMLETGVKIGQVASQRRTEVRLKESEERYALAAQGANDGLWDWKLTTGEVFYSPRWKAMLGYEEGEIKATLEEWFGRVHPEDRGAVEAELDAHLEGRRPHFEVEHQMAHRDGSYRWMLARGIAVRDAEGSALRMAGTQTDVTPRKMAELALVEAREDLGQKLALLRRQERAIRELSTPILRVWEGVVALPIIGSLDEARAAQLTERLLEELSRSHAAVAILDLTGVAAMDAHTAGHLVRVMRAARLLGSQCVVAGLSPLSAQSLVELGVDTSGLPFFAEVKSALAWVFQGLGARLSRRSSDRGDRG
jgi:PAS domain S-box-containing protein